MRARPLAAVVFAACALLLGLATPTVASAAPAQPRVATVGAVAAVVAAPACVTAGLESLSNTAFINGQFLHGTWTYATGISCSAPQADLALGEVLQHNGVRVASKFKGFTGVARSIDAITQSVRCAVCNGTWLITWAQVMKAPSGTLFSTPPAGCTLVQGGAYEQCVETKTVTL
jgi:hypothetical protein